MAIFENSFFCINVFIYIPSKSLQKKKVNIDLQGQIRIFTYFAHRNFDRMKKKYKYRNWSVHFSPFLINFLTEQFYKEENKRREVAKIRMQ